MAVTLSPSDIDALARVAQAEADVMRRQGAPDAASGIAAVVDTIINRAGSGQFPSTIPGVVNQGANHRNGSQFTPVAEAGGSWQKLPKASTITQQIVRDHLAARANGQPSIVGGSLNYLNPKYSSTKASLGWAADMIAHPFSIFGIGNAQHFHGTAKGFSPFEANVVLSPEAALKMGVIPSLGAYGEYRARLAPSPNSFGPGQSFASGLGNAQRIASASPAASPIVYPGGPLPSPTKGYNALTGQSARTTPLGSGAPSDLTPWGPGPSARQQAVNQIAADPALPTPPNLIGPDVLNKPIVPGSVPSGPGQWFVQGLVSGDEKMVTRGAVGMAMSNPKAVADYFTQLRATHPEIIRAAGGAAQFNPGLMAGVRAIAKPEQLASARDAMMPMPRLRPGGPVQSPQMPTPLQGGTPTGTYRPPSPSVTPAQRIAATSNYSPSVAPPSYANFYGNSTSPSSQPATLPSMYIPGGTTTKLPGAYIPGGASSPSIAPSPSMYIPGGVNAPRPTVNAAAPPRAPLPIPSTPIGYGAPPRATPMPVMLSPAARIAAVSGLQGYQPLQQRAIQARTQQAVAPIARLLAGGLGGIAGGLPGMMLGGKLGNFISSLGFGGNAPSVLPGQQSILARYSPAIQQAVSQGKPYQPTGSPGSQGGGIVSGPSGTFQTNGNGTYTSLTTGRTFSLNPTVW